MREATATLRDYPTSFVGRAADLEALGQALADGARLVTVIGPAGVGKTRLAVELCRSLAARGQEVCFCDLTEAESLPDLCRSLAGALGVTLDSTAGEGDEVRLLGDALAARGPGLLVLDNFERLTEVAPGTLPGWLDAAPAIRILVTSRERLHLTGELIHDLLPLPVPTDGEDADASDAVQLFVERARASRRGFRLRAEDGRAVSELVRRLDGLPLAIELAAARTRTLGLAELLSQIDRRFELLGRGPRDDRRGHETLEAAIAWSWDHLAAEERLVLSGCSVFRGGFTLEAAAAVLDRPPAVLAQVLEQLQDRSLLRTEEPDDGPVRFRMYESIRDFALLRLSEASALDATCERHARFYVDLGERLAGTLDGPDDAAARRRLACELENLVAVQAWCVAAPLAVAERATLALGAALAAEPVLSARGPNATYLSLFQTALALAAEAEGAVDVILRVRGLLGRSEARLRQGQIPESLADLAQADALCRTQQQPAWSARVRRRMGAWSWAQGYLKEASTAFEDALTQSRSARDRFTEGRVLNELARVRLLQADLSAAADLCERSLRIQQELGDRLYEARVLACLGGIALDRGRLQESRHHLERAREIAREHDDPYTETMAVMDLGTLSQEAGALADARAHHASCVSMVRRLGKTQSEALCRAFYACCLEEAAEAEEARREYEEAIALARQSKNELAEGLALGWMGRLLSGLGEVEAAERSLDAAAERLETVGDRVRWEVVHLCRGHLDLACAVEAGEAGAHQARRDLLARAAARAAAARGPGSYLDRSADVRGALRMLEAALRAAGVDTTGQAPSDARSGDVLVVGADGKWFRPPGGDEVRIETRGALCLLMGRLAERRDREPGTPSSVEHLFEVGWPGQKALPRSAASRVYVAMSTLRGLGLRDILLRHHDGYLLDPDVPVSVAEDRGT